MEKFLTSIVLQSNYGSGFDAEDVISIYADVVGTAPLEEFAGFKVYKTDNSATSGSNQAQYGDSGDFETASPWDGVAGSGAEGFIREVDGTIARTTGGHAGTYCAEFTFSGSVAYPNTNNPRIIYQAPSTLTLGKRYIASCFVRMPSSNPLVDPSNPDFVSFGNRPSVQLMPVANAYDNSIYLVESSTVIDLIGALDSWYEMQLVFTVAKSNSFYPPAIVMDVIPFIGDCETGGTLLIDEFYIYEDTGFSQSTSAITSGPDLGILQINQFDNVTYNYSTGIVESNYKFCQGTVLKRFTGILTNPAFPYISLVEDLNSNQCQVSAPAPCDIYVQSSVVTATANQFSSTGTITVVAISSKSDVRYSLSDVNYEFMTNSTGIFIQLSAGTYTVYCRDFYNCRTTVTLTVIAIIANVPQPPQPPAPSEPSVVVSYQPKYRLEFDDEINGQECRLDITERNFNGSVTTVNGSDDPITIDLSNVNVNDKFDPLAPTSMTVGLMNYKDSQFIGLFTQDERKYRVNFYNPVGTLKWRGYIIPSIFSEPYTVHPPYPTYIKCTDGIADLGKKDFLDASKNKLSGLKPVIYIIALILKKLDLDLQIRVGCNIRENSGFFYIDTFHPMEAFYEDDGTPWICERVLTTLLKPVGAKVVQDGGYWNIVKIEEQTDEYNVRIYDVYGEYVSSSTYDPIMEIKEVVHRQDASFALHDHQLEIVPAYGSITITRKLYVKPNLVQSGGFEFEDWDGSNYKGWSVDLTGGSGIHYAPEKIILRKEIKAISDSNVPRWQGPDYIRFSSPAQLGSYAFAISNIEDQSSLKLTANPFPIQYNNYDFFKFSFDYRFNLGSNRGRGYRNPLYVLMRWKLQIGEYYYNDAVGWDTDPIYEWNNLYVTEFNKTVNFEKTLNFREGTNTVTSQVQIAFQFYSTEYKDFEDLTELTAIPTLPLPVGSLIYGTNDDGFGDYDAYWELTSDPANVHPDDYDGSTNQVAWLRLAYGLAGVTYELNLTPVEKIYLDNVDFDFYPSSTNPPDSAEYTQVNNVNYQEDLPVELETADLPEQTINSKKYIYRNFLYDQAGNPTDIWQREGVVEELSLIKLLMKSLINQYRNPTFKVNGTMIGFSQIGFLTTLKHIIPGAMITLTNEEFTGSISGWENVGAGDAWTYNSNAARVTITGGTDTQILSQDVDLSGSQRISVAYDITRSSSAGVRGDWLVAVLFSENSVVQDVVLNSNIATDGNLTGIVKFSISQESDAIGFYVRNIEGSATCIYDMAYFRVVGLTLVRYFTPSSLSKNVLKSQYSGEWRQLIPVILSADPTIDDSGEGNTDTEGGLGLPPSTGGDFSGDFSNDFGYDFDTVYA